MSDPSQDYAAAKDSGGSARDALLAAGLDLFGRFGFDGVSVRQICDAAQTNVASVNYHFGSKHGLYDAVANFILSSVQAHMAPVVGPAMAFLEADSADRNAALEHVLAIHERFIDLLVPDSPDTERWARFIVRFQLGDAPADHALSHNHIASLLGTLIGIAIDRRDDRHANTLQALTFFGQVQVFRVSRLTTKTMLGIDRFDADEIDAVKRTVLDNIRRCLRGDASP